MSDFLVELGANPTARNVIKRLGLPLPMPQKLTRGDGPWAAKPFAGKTIAVGAASDVVHVLDHVLPALAEAGADLFVEGDAAELVAEVGTQFGRPVGALAARAETPEKPHALVLDATGVANAEELKALLTFFQPRVRNLATCGRCIVIGRDPSETTSVSTGAARRALEGFVRSLSKEVGGKGATANLILVGKGKETAIGPVLRWLLTPRSAFLTGQPILLQGKKAPEVIPTTRPLDGKVVLVTGAARGIGEATAECLAREGAHVLCLDRPADAEPLAEVAARVGGTAVPVDITAEDAAERILAAADAVGGLYAVIHNAGITRDKTLAKMDDARWDLTLEVNLGAILRTTETLAKAMPDHGRIVALSSVAGIAGNFGQTNYAASKAGVIGFIDTLAPKLAKRGITVNGIAPGFIETRLTAAIPVATREGGRRLSALSQGGLPIDIAEALTFLVTPGAWGITGRVTRVCGGALIGA